MIPDNNYRNQEPRVIVESAMAHLHAVNTVLREAEKRGGYTPDEMDMTLINRIADASYAAQLLMLYLGHTIEHKIDYMRLSVKYKLRGILGTAGIVAAICLGIIWGWIFWGKTL